MKIGEKKNRLTLLKLSGKNKHGKRMGLFKCECGKEKEMIICGVKNGYSKSCDCLRGKFSKHNMTESPEYIAWCGMKARCYNNKENGYKNYGGRGIIVCDRWLHCFENFIEDMGLRPGPKFTIERIDVNKNYCKENCEWNTYKVQANNRTNNIFLTLNGTTKTLAQWSEETKIPYPTLYNRLKHNLTVEQILTIKPASKNRWKNLV